MGCRVGMSTDPETRIEHWKREEGHTHGKVLASHLTYDEAQDREKVEALRRNCVSSPGGAKVGGRVWSVYHVWGGAVAQ